MRSSVIILAVAAIIVSGCGADRYQVRMNRAEAYLNQRQYDNARIEIMQMIADHPQSPDPYYMLGRIHYDEMKYGECLFNLEEAERRGLEPTREYFIIKGVSLYQVGENQKAAETFEKMPDAASSGAVQKYLGLIYTELGVYDKAVMAFERASGVENDPVALSARGYAMFRSGHTADALGIFQKALTLAPDNEEIIFRTANLLLLTGKDADANDLYKRLGRESRFFAESLYNRAEIAIRAGEYPAAVNLLDTYLTYRGNDSSAIINLGSALIKTGEYARAADLLTVLVEKEYSARAAYNLALAYYKLGRYAESAGQLATVVREYPDNTSYRYAYGLSLASTGDTAAAAEQMSAVLVLDPGNSDARSWLESHLVPTE